MTTTGKESLWNAEYIKIMLNNFDMYFSPDRKTAFF